MSRSSTIIPHRTQFHVFTDTLDGVHFSGLVWQFAPIHLMLTGLERPLEDDG